MHLIDRLKVRAKRLKQLKTERHQAGQHPAQHQDALKILAGLQGFASWRSLQKNATFDFYPRQTGIGPQIWCKSSAEGQGLLAKSGGYLIPYGKHCFIAPIEYVESLGVKKDDADLARVGVDWTRPLDQKAFSRLVTKIKKMAGHDE